MVSIPKTNGDGGNPREAALEAGNRATTQHAQMIQRLTGGKKRKTRGGSQTASQFTLQYNPGSSDPNKIVAQIQTTQNQSAENAKYDHHVNKTGGGKRKWIKTKKRSRSRRRRRTMRKRR